MIPVLKPIVLFNAIDIFTSLVNVEQHRLVVKKYKISPATIKLTSVILKIDN